MRGLIFSLLFFALHYANSQNSKDFFKSIPVISSSTPDWAALMYGDNPNVKEVQRKYRAYYKINDFTKTIHTQNYKNWIRLIKNLVNEHGYIIQPIRKEEDQRAFELRSRYIKRNQNRNSNNDWECIGPFETYKKGTSQPISWHKNIYVIDQSLSNSNLLICGTEAGGVYKTTDKGLNWALVSKGEVFSGSNSAIKIHPTDQNTFLLASNRRIYKSSDGGLSWSEKHYINGTGNEFAYSPANNNVIFLTANTGLFKSIDGGDTWSSVMSDECWDIDFHPTSASTVYLLKSNASTLRSELFRSDDGGSTWLLKDNGWYTPADLQNADDEGGKIATTAVAPDIVYVCLIGASKANDDGWIGVYKSSNKGDSWVNPSGQDGSPYGAINSSNEWNVAAYPDGYHQGYYNFDMEASQLDSNKLWVGTIRLSESSDGGATFESIGASESNRLDDIHADIQDIEVIGSDIWVASDGGLNYSNDNLNTHVALNKGIQAAHFWGFNTGWNEDTYTGGKYHDGTSGWAASYPDGKTYNIGGVEEASGYVHPIESRKLLFRRSYGSTDTRVITIPQIFGNQAIEHASLPIRPNEHYWTAERSGIYYDPRYANHIYVGLENKIYKSINGGNSFEVIYAFPDVDGMVYEIEISRSNPDYMYCVYNKLGGYWDPCEVWKSSDGGVSWIKMVNPSGNNLRYRISLDPEDENKVWLCTARGQNGHKVFYSANGGQSWINKTTSVLDDENITDILYQAGSNEMVYVISDNGVFYWDTNVSDWVDYSQGLPLISSGLQINPFYKESELRFASEGRGVWKRKLQDSLFSPLAQPITYGDTILCKEDTVIFDCYSILNHNGASWNWSISPSPSYISSNITRSIQVVFDQAGSYDVSLSVTNAQGLSNTKTINNMVFVKDECFKDTIPGLALNCNSNQSYVNTPDLKLNSVDSFTISAWINPSSSQENWSSIVMNDGDGAGLNFYDDDWNKPNRQLGYHWPGGAWWWESGLFVDTNEWSHVAMVTTPTSVTLYLNGEASVHNTLTNPVDISSMKIGSYQAWSSRNFRGLIDEVCLWTKALTQDEIRELRHLTRTGSNPFTEDLVLYYQFNLDNSSSVLDRIGFNHSALSGSAEKVVSTAPFGNGVSDRLSVNSSGKYYFPNTETTMDFQSSTPNGELVVTRIHSLPDSLPNTNPYVSNYWILNNYGSSNFAALDSIKLKPSNSVPSGNPTEAFLYSRSDNEHLSNWSALCSALSHNGDVFNYTASCNITNAQQLFVQSSTSNQISSPLSSVTDIEFNEIGEALSIYPNPTNGGVNIGLGKEYDNVEIRLFNLSSQLIITNQLGTQKEVYMDLNIPAGIYTMHILIDGEAKAAVKVLRY